MNDFILSNEFLKDYLPRLADADMIKVLLYIQSRFNQQEGENHYLFVRQILHSTTLQHWMGGSNEEERIRMVLKSAISSGFLLSGKIHTDGKKTLIFFNNQEGKATLDRLQKGLWQPSPTDHPRGQETQPQKNIYQLYEENIGPLTPLLSEDLTAAQEEFPHHWIEEAIHIAVQNNARSWRYIDAVLKSWQKEGKNVQSRRDSETYESRRNKSSEYDDFIQH